MRSLRLIIIGIVAALVLVACGGNSNTFPEPTITSVQPTEVMAGEELTVMGSNYYAVTGAGSTRIEACGVTLNGSLVEPLTRTILLPPGSTITAEVGSTITGTLPEEGITAGLSDVRVTRPDGSTAVLENAVTCVIPSEEPEPTPVTAVFTASSTTGVAPAIITFNAEGSTGEGELDYSWDFGVEGATATGAEVSFEYLEAGTFTVTLTVTDAYGGTDSSEATVQIIDSAAPTGDLAGPESAFVYEDVTFTWDLVYSGLDDLTCEFNPGDGSAPVALDCSTGSTTHAYDWAGDYTATLTVQDETNAPVNLTHGITVEATAEAPVIDTWDVEFAYNDPDGEIIIADFLIQGRNFTSEPVTCSIDFGDNTEPLELGAACVDETQHIIPYSDYEVDEAYEATLTITDTHGNRVIDSTAVHVNNPYPPAIYAFTSNRHGPLHAHFSWYVHTDPRLDDSLITCTFNPGGDSDVTSVIDCDPNETNNLIYAYDSPGEYTATVTVTDPYNDPAMATHTVNIIDPQAPQILEFEVTSPLTLPANATVTWEFNDPEGRVMSCHFYSGINPDWEIGDQNYSGCSAGHHSGFYYDSYDAPDVYEATFMLLDADKNEITRETVDVVVRAPAPPTLSSFTSNTPVDAGETITFTWDHTYDGQDFYSYCSLDPDDGTGAIPLTDCASGQYEYEYTSAGTYDATFTINDRYNDAVSETHEVVVRPAPPIIDSFTSDHPVGTPVEANAPVTFEWDVTYNGLDDLTCEFNPGDDSAPVTLDNCLTGSATHEYELADDYTATLTVQDETNGPVERTQGITVTATAPAPSIGRWNAFLEYLDPDGEEITVSFDVRGDNASGSVTCTIDFGDNREPWELGDACIGDSRHTFEYPHYEIGETYEATVTITDTHGNRVSRITEVNVTNPIEPVIKSFTTSGTPTVNEPSTFTWEADLDTGVSGVLIYCTFDPGDGSPTTTTRDCDSGSINHTYTTRGDPTATFTVNDSYNPEVTQEYEFTVIPAPVRATN